MKKLYVVILIISLLSVISFTIFTSADKTLLNKEDAIKVGEEKYLEFLWMIDGAFNDERYEYSFVVNDKSLNDNKKIFTCNYPKNNKRTCFANNFENAFHNLFVNKISYEDVYSDKVSFSWYAKKDNEFEFTNMNTCNAYRMGKVHNLQVISIDKRKLFFRVTFKDDRNNRVFDKMFVLSYEDNDWKISKAYYHDPCYMDYNIE